MKSDYECIRCRKKLTLNTTCRTLDLKDMCILCYKNTSFGLGKGVFTSDEAFTSYQAEKSLATERNNMLRTMLKASLLNGDNVNKFIKVFEKEYKEHLNTFCYFKDKEVSSKAKNNLIKHVYDDYKRLFGDFTIEQVNKVTMRDVKGRYYEWLDQFNTDIDVKVVEDEETTSNNSNYFFN